MRQGVCSSYVFQASLLVDDWGLDYCVHWRNEDQQPNEENAQANHQPNEDSNRTYYACLCNGMYALPSKGCKWHTVFKDGSHGHMCWWCEHRLCNCGCGCNYIAGTGPSAYKRKVEDPEQDPWTGGKRERW